MTATRSGSSTARRITWAVLVVAAAGAAAALGWSAGQRAEQRDATAVEERLAVAEPRIAKADAIGARPAVPPVRNGSGSADRSAAPARAASNPNGRELKPLPWPFWEFRLRQPIPPRSPPLVPPSWRLIGATESAGTWSLVVLRQGNAAPEFFKVGDDLPGGYRIAAITQDDATLISGGRQVVLSYIGIR